MTFTNFSMERMLMEFTTSLFSIPGITINAKKVEEDP